MEALKTLRDIARNPARVANEWRAQGGRVLGCRCLYVPEEVIWAAGMLPYPLYGTPDPIGEADSYFQSCTCEFIRNVFDRVLAGETQFLDGLVVANTCDVVLSRSTSALGRTTVACAPRFRTQPSISSMLLSLIRSRLEPPGNSVMSWLA